MAWESFAWRSLQALFDAKADSCRPWKGRGGATAWHAAAEKGAEGGLAFLRALAQWPTESVVPPENDEDDEGNAWPGYHRIVPDQALSARDGRGRTPLHLAAEWDGPKALTVLLGGRGRTAGGEPYRRGRPTPSATSSARSSFLPSLGGSPRRSQSARIDCPPQAVGRPMHAQRRAGDQR